jgi:hypothetical protein
MMPRAVDPSFLALPLDRLADVALDIARKRGATYADFRVERLRSHVIVARDRELQTSVEGETVGFSVRVVANGAWGFAAGIDLTVDAVSDVARRAVEVAQSLAPLNTEPVTLADEPVYHDTYVSSYEIDPFAVAEDHKINFLLTLNERALASKLIDRVTSYVMLVREQKYLASLSGSRITQQRVRVKGDFTCRPHRQIHGCVRDDGQRGAAGRAGVGVLHDRLRLGKGRGRNPGAARTEDGVALDRAGPLRRRHRPDELMADDSRVNRPFHRAGSRARVRGELRGHIVRHAR